MLISPERPGSVSMPHARYGLSATAQQNAWQLRWRRGRRQDEEPQPQPLRQQLATIDLTGATPPPPPPPAHGQSKEAAESVRIALSQLIPPPGDGRRGGYDNQVNVKRESDTVRRLLREGGLDEWRPEPSCLPDQAPPGASMDVLLKDVPVNGTAWLAFGNAGVTEMLNNWLYHVCRLGMCRRMVVAAYDEELLGYLRARRVPVYNYTGALPAIHFRGTPFLFNRMGFLKARTIREVLLTGRHVLVSDSDVAWLHDPTAELLALAAAGANLAPATDCINVEADNDKSTRPRAPYLCGHLPGSTDGAVFNTGIIFLAATPATVAFCQRWAETTLHLSKDQWWSDDQGVFNQLLTGLSTWPARNTGFYPVRPAGLGGKLIHAPDGLVLAPLPSERFCSGHLVWMQQDAKPLGCNAVHATFTEFGDAGKRWRFLEAGLWGPLPSRYYSEGRYLTFEPPLPPADPAPCGPLEGRYVPGGPLQKPCGGEAPGHGLGPKRRGDIPADEAASRSLRVRQNLELMRRQLHALRDALALAFVLNRTLVLPHFDCMCDRSELVDYVPSCVFPGAPPRLAFPRKCSTHFVLNIHKLMYFFDPPRHGLRAAPPIQLRAHAFLHDPRTKPIRESAASVRVIGPPPALEAHPRCSAPHDRSCLPPLLPGGAEGRAAALAAEDEAKRRRGGGGEGGVKDGVKGGGEEVVELRRGATDADVMRVLGSESMRRKRLLRLSDAEGVFSGWSAAAGGGGGGGGGWLMSPGRGDTFKTMESYYLFGGDWCCSSRRANEGRLYPVDPPRLR